MAADDDIKNSIAHFLIEVKKNTESKLPIYMALTPKDEPENGVMSTWRLFRLIFPTIYMKPVWKLMRIDDRLEPRPFKDDAFNVNDPLAVEVKSYGILLER